MYDLGLIVLGFVVAVTAVFALVAYVIDKGESELEGGKFDEHVNGNA